MPALERSGNGALALHYAAARGCLDCVKLLVESSSELSANTQMDNAVTPVYLAAQEGHLEVLRYLVASGGSLYVRAKDGMAPLHAAAQMGCLPCLKWMGLGRLHLRFPVASSAYGRVWFGTCADSTRSFKCSSSAKQRRERCRCPTRGPARGPAGGPARGRLNASLRCADSSDADCESESSPPPSPKKDNALLMPAKVQEQQVDPNLRDGDGATPLHFAASRGHVETVRWLLRHGARLVLDRHGKSAINDAAENQQMECLSVLVQHGTTPDYQDDARLAAGKLHACTCRKGDISTKCSYADCVNQTPPFYLHPPPDTGTPSPPVHTLPGDGLYVNPMTPSSDPFYLHDPRSVVPNRVRTLFSTSNGSSALSNSPHPSNHSSHSFKVKVEVHSGSSGAGSDENLSSSSDGSEPLHEHDYEDIYLVRSDSNSVKGSLRGRSRSRDSGSHSRFSSPASSLTANLTANTTVEVANVPPPPPPPPQQPSSPVLTEDAILRHAANAALRRADLSQDEHSLAASTESGVSSGSPSDLGHSEEETDRSQQQPPPPPPPPPQNGPQVLARQHSLSSHAISNSSGSTNNRALKRVVSEPGFDSSTISSAASNGPRVSPALGRAPPYPPSGVHLEEECVHATGEDDEETKTSNGGSCRDRCEHLDGVEPSATVTVTKSETVVQLCEETECTAQVTPTACAKQPALPFIPPRFPNNAGDSNALIKPSEYLRSISITPSATSTTSATSSASTISSTCCVSSANAVCPPPPPPPPPPVAHSVLAAGLQTALAGLHRIESADFGHKPTEATASASAAAASAAAASASASASAAHGDGPMPPSPSATRKQQQQQPLSAISIQDLNSVQLRKTLSGPSVSPFAKNGVMLQSGKTDQNKQDLIAELKMSKDISGIKKLKVERAKTEERHEREIISEISKQLTATQFVEKVPETDATGNPIPPWKRQMLARKAAEKARREMEEKLQRDAEQKRLQSIPAWKRQLLAKKEEAGERVALYTPRVVEERRDVDLSRKSTHEECNKENSVPTTSNSTSTSIGGWNASISASTDHLPTSSTILASSSTMEDRPVQIIPWRAQLRKTNSTLSLLE